MESRMLSELVSQDNCAEFSKFLHVIWILKQWNGYSRREWLIIEGASVFEKRFTNVKLELNLSSSNGRMRIKIK